MSCHPRHRRRRREAVEGTGAVSSGLPAGSPAALPGVRQDSTDTDLEAGQVIKLVAGGTIARALGAAGPSSPLAGDGSGDLVVGVAWPAATAGSVAMWFATGSSVPISGLPVGPIFRSPLGRLVAGSDLSQDDWTNQVGISDGTRLEVLISPPFQWSAP